MGDRIKGVYLSFDQHGFESFILPGLNGLSYSERLGLITEALEQFLPKDFPTAASILIDSLMDPYLSDQPGEMKDRFIVATKAAYVGRNGLGHFDISMNALYEITRRLTAEWGVRPFFLQFPHKTLSVFNKWAVDDDPHVRRLVSEGSRPYLPWGKKIPLFENEPMYTIPLLEKLKDDPSEYVRRSVANHLNDHSKKHPDLVVQTLKRWKEEKGDKNRRRLIRHALRTLLKKGHPGALALLGFQTDARVAINNLVADKKVAIGDYLNFSFELCAFSKNKQALMVDYIIFYRKANGGLSPRVFKLTTLAMEEGEQVFLSKRQSFKVITTRKYQLGQHRLAIQVNGVVLAEIDFELVDLL